MVQQIVVTDESLRQEVAGIREKLNRLMADPEFQRREAEADRQIAGALHVG